MKHLLLSTVAVALATATSGFAGPYAAQSTKSYAAPQPQGTVYGTGLYIAIQAGINAHQEYRGLEDQRIDDIRFSFEPESKIGGIVGGKIGYVFGTASIRPAVEIDAFYNGWKAETEFSGGGVTGTSETDVHSGAALVNFLVRFDFGRFQPYIGAGLGFYTTGVDKVDINVDGTEVDVDSDETSSGFSWQLVAGSDYYFNEKLSAFLEYKYLNYESDGDVFGEDRIDQHIIALGLRLHF